VFTYGLARVVAGGLFTLPVATHVHHVGNTYIYKLMHCVPCSWQDILLMTVDVRSTLFVPHWWCNCCLYLLLLVCSSRVPSSCLLFSLVSSSVRSTTTKYSCCCWSVLIPASAYASRRITSDWICCALLLLHYCFVLLPSICIVPAHCARVHPARIFTL
jgi:hypothetical protein